MRTASRTYPRRRRDRLTCRPYACWLLGLPGGLSVSIAVAGAPPDTGGPRPSSAASAAASATTTCRVRVLHDFGADADDGRRPLGGLVRGSGGMLLGTTSAGGRHRRGSVFAISPGGRLTRLHDFAGSADDGADPEAAPTPQASGALLGTTTRGGAHGLGTVYRIDARGRESVLHAFGALAGDGAHPEAPLTLDADGWFYGSTRDGGAHAGGRLFRIRDDGRYQALQSFGADGALAQPVGALALGSHGSIVGAAAAGGHDDQGGVFEAGAGDAAPRTRLEFGSVGDCRLPLAGLRRGRDGSLVGTTYAGGQANGGCLFQLDARGAYRVLLELPRGEHGAQPLSLPLETRGGAWLLSSSLGAAHGDGALLLVPRDGASARVLHAFGRADVSMPEGRLVRGEDGRIYGTAPYGGAHDEGGVFVVDECSASARPGARPAPIERHAFGADAAAPAHAMAGLTGGMDGALYGTSALGGSFGKGTLFRLGADDSLGVLHDFGAEGDGALPSFRAVVGRDGALYGTTQTGGGSSSQDMGVVWRLGAAGDWRVLHGFRGGADDGSHPTGSLLSASDGKLYGVTRGGGAYGFGVLYRIGVDGGFDLLHSFGAPGATADLRFPVGAPMQARDATVYGVARDGGAHGRGGVYRWRQADGMRLLTSFDAVGDDVALPLGLVEQPQGCLLGTSRGGGAHGRGTVFRVCGDGSHAIVHSFGADGDGAWPSAELTAAGESAWYGVTSRGGARDQGTVFRVGRNDAYESVWSFDAAGGGAAAPQGRLLLHGRGRLWGVHARGGRYGMGGIFSYDIDDIDHIGGPDRQAAPRDRN